MTASQDDKADRRRAELAESALRTLSELGYARTSVREIAQNSPYSHGVLHYYFKDKVELIIEAVRLYTRRGSLDYDALIAMASSADELEASVVGMLRDSMGPEATYHRLWYDLRTQGMYEAAFRDHINEIDAWLREVTHRVMTRYAELRGRELVWPADLIYAAADGMFQKALFDRCGDKPGVADWLEQQARDLMRLSLAPE